MGYAYGALAFCRHFHSWGCPAQDSKVKVVLWTSCAWVGRAGIGGRERGGLDLGGGQNRWCWLTLYPNPYLDQLHLQYHWNRTHLAVVVYPEARRWMFPYPEDISSSQNFTVGYRIASPRAAASLPTSQVLHFPGVTFHISQRMLAYLLKNMLVTC